MPRLLSQSDVADFRERLCEAATKLFADRGPQGFTMRELAAELGVSAMTPYRYFKDKDDILAAVRARAFDRFSDALEAAYAVPGSAPERSARVGSAYVRFAFGQPAAYRLMFDLSQPDEEAYPALVAATARARKTMTQYVRGLVDEGFLQGDPELMGHVFWAALHGAVVLQLAGKLSPQYGFETISRASFEALSRAFAAGN